MSLYSVVDFRWQIFGRIFTGRKLRNSHRKLDHILHCKQRDVSPGLHSGGVLASEMPVEATMQFLLKFVLFTAMER